MCVCLWWYKHALAIKIKNDHYPHFFLRWRLIEAVKIVQIIVFTKTCIIITIDFFCFDPFELFPTDQKNWNSLFSRSVAEFSTIIYLFFIFFFWFIHSTNDYHLQTMIMTFDWLLRACLCRWPTLEIKLL